MVRNYKRKTKMSEAPQEIYDNAVTDVIDNNMSLRKAAQKYGINFMTLQRYKKKLTNPSKYLPTLLHLKGSIR